MKKYINIKNLLRLMILTCIFASVVLYFKVRSDTDEINRLNKAIEKDNKKLELLKDKNRV